MILFSFLSLFCLSLFFFLLFSLSLQVEAAWIAKKSDMDLDTVKRLFSNNKYEDVIGGFWESFDHSTYTMWETTYNYNDDNKIDWMTANYVGGVLQVCLFIWLIWLIWLIWVIWLRWGYSFWERLVLFVVNW